MFTLARRKIGLFGSREQYIVTPFLEAIPPALSDDAQITGPDGETKIPLKDAIKAAHRKKSQPYDSVIKAALIPYESNPDHVSAETKVDIPSGDEASDIKVAFTAGMNGCSIAVKKKSDTELSVWHYPSPGSHEAQWEEFQSDNNIIDTYDWDEYNQEPEASKSPTEHITTTVLVRDQEGQWNIKSQQNRGPVGGGDSALQVGYIHGRKLKV